MLTKCHVTDFRQFIGHFVDNNRVTDDDKLDRVWKLQPWIKQLRTNFSLVSCGEYQSIDEIMVAFKGRSILKMYLPKKPKKWGFKLWGRASPEGFLHDFNVYQGKGTGLGGNDTRDCGLGGNVVLQLTEALPPKPFKIFADNFFSNFAMAVGLKKRGLHFTGTIAANRLRGAPLKSEKELGKEGKGASCSTYESNHNLSLVRWLDNKCVTLISTYLGVTPELTVKCCNRSTKVDQDVSRPAIVGVYNSYMGGIDLFDIMCTLYKRQLKSKRWYLYVFYHTLTMIMVNSWFLYRREAKSLGVDNAMQMKDFQVKATVSLISQGKVSQGRPSFNSPPPAKKHCVKPRPQDDILIFDDICFDNVDHWPLSQEK